MKSSIQRRENTLESVKEEGERTARTAAFSPLVEKLARLGFGARGLIYFMMGLIAVQVAFGGSSKTADQQGALAAIGAQPVGRILLWIVLVGLVGYVLWSFIRSLFDPLHFGKDAAGIMERLWSLTSALTYGSLILPTYGLLNSGSKAAQNGAQTAQTQNSVSQLMSGPGGRWIVGILGLIVIGIGLAQIYQGLSRNFDRQFRFYELNRQQSIWIKRLGRFGTAARGVTYGLIGLFLMVAAYQANPAKAVGVDGALQKLVELPYGPWLLGLVALGLMAFGVYSLTGALWFRFKNRGGKK